ncbi:MAG: non-heme iron oxygenase ferredoxin subunit [Candidatus Nanopelagicales bacterium]
MTVTESVCRVTDLPPGTAARVEVDGEPVALVHTAQGEFYAVGDICSHAAVSLTDGEVAGVSIECWLHGSRFDLRTGAPSGPPASDPIPTYQVTIEGDLISVSV